LKKLFFYLVIWKILIMNCQIGRGGEMKAVTGELWQNKSPLSRVNDNLVER